MSLEAPRGWGPAGLKVDACLGGRWKVLLGPGVSLRFPGNQRGLPSAPARFQPDDQLFKTAGKAKTINGFLLERYRNMTFLVIQTQNHL